MRKKDHKYRVGVVGATGLVGRELIQVLERREFPVAQLKVYASERSKGKKISFQRQEIEVEAFAEEKLKGLDFIFLCAGSKLSRLVAKNLAQNGAVVIDNSSAFRMDKEVPLVIPEINPEALKKHQGLIASPNCTTTLLLMALFPLHKAFTIKRIVASTYQAASGGGAKLIQRLLSETQEWLEKRETSSGADYPYGFNLYLHDSPLQEDRYNEEERKMVLETRKILQDDFILVTATCVRVPVLRVHSIAVNVEFSSSFSLAQIYESLRLMKGLEIREDWSSNRFPTPFDAVEKETIYCGRIRLDSTQPKTLELWIVGDQLLKGAALNAVQIAEQMI